MKLSNLNVYNGVQFSFLLQWSRISTCTFHDNYSLNCVDLTATNYVESLCNSHVSRAYCRSLCCHVIYYMETYVAGVILLYLILFPG